MAKNGKNRLSSISPSVGRHFTNTDIMAIEVTWQKIFLHSNSQYRIEHLPHRRLCRCLHHQDDDDNNNDRNHNEVAMNQLR